jgi:hypothetical protein
MMKMMKVRDLRGWAMAAACILALACGSGGSGGGGVDAGGGGDSGALDGTWTWVSATCNGTAMSMVTITATFSGSSGELTNTLDASCAATTSCTVSYPSAGSFTWTMSSAETCNPANCVPSICNAPASNHVFSGTYTIQGNQATLTIPQTPADYAGCASGFEVITMQR